MIIKWLLIVLIAVAVILFLGGIFEWFDWIPLYDYEYTFEPIAHYLAMQYVAVLVLLLIHVFSQCTWAGPAMKTLALSMIASTALTVVGFIISPTCID